MRTLAFVLAVVATPSPTPTQLCAKVYIWPMAGANVPVTCFPAAPTLKPSATPTPKPTAQAKGSV